MDDNPDKQDYFPLVVMGILGLTLSTPYGLKELRRRGTARLTSELCKFVEKNATVRYRGKTLTRHIYWSEEGILTYTKNTQQPKESSLSINDLTTKIESCQVDKGLEGGVDWVTTRQRKIFDRRFSTESKIYQRDIIWGDSVDKYHNRFIRQKR
jgi:hypothetical protein